MPEQFSRNFVGACGFFATKMELKARSVNPFLTSIYYPLSGSIILIKVQ
jgi:hypothetical protein